MKGGSRGDRDTLPGLGELAAPMKGGSRGNRDTAWAATVDRLGFEPL